MDDERHNEVTEEVCEESHRYVIATTAGISPIFHDPEEARDYQESLTDPLLGAWVAFHKVPIETLVSKPHSIETYCSVETRRHEITSHTTRS